MAVQKKPNRARRQFVRWMNQAERDPYYEPNGTLLQALGFETSTHRHSESSDKSANPTVEPFRRIRKPLTVRLATSIGNMIRTRQVASQSKANGSPVYSLPWWLAWDPGPFQEARPSFQVSVSKRGPLKIQEIVKGGELESGQLDRVTLRPREPSKKRRNFLTAAAADLHLDELEKILGPASAPSWDWLVRMIDDPVGVENDALEIWHDFIADCNLPSSFRIPGRALSLRGLMTLREGSGGGCHRHLFAEQHPWAAQEVLREPCPYKEFAQIDQNPANAIELSAKCLCCNPEAIEKNCPKAVEFAKLLARHKHNPALDSLLGTQSRRDRRIRAILMEAHARDRELLTHIGRKAKETRRQIKQAIRIIFDYRGMGGGIGCGYELATLMVRMMVRNPIDPQNIDRELFLRGLITVSADCLAAFASDRLADPSVISPEPDADSIDIGLLAFIAFLGRTQKPQLTINQLNKFAMAANERGVHKTSAVKDRPGANWEPAPVWPTLDHFDPNGVMRISELTSIKDILKEGRRMKNCLADGRYVRASILGRLALFSISGGSDRATLSLKPLQRQNGEGETWIDKWELDQLFGVANSEPSRACEDVAELLIQRLNARCPYLVPYSEVARRKQILIEMDESRCTNADIVSAQQYWKEIYLELLPRRFENLSPSKMVDDYLNDD